MVEFCLSTNPFVWGEYSGVYCSFMPILADILRHSSDTNSDPLSLVQKVAKPCLATQEWSRASAQACVVASDIGMASTNLVDLQITIRRYLKPLLAGRGPQTSTCIRENLFCGTVLKCTSQTLTNLIHHHKSIQTKRTITALNY